MTEVTPALLSWSSGKHGAWPLYLLEQAPQYRVCGLLTTVIAAFDRVAMHGMRIGLLEAQAASTGLPLHYYSSTSTSTRPWPCSNEIYEAQRQGAHSPAVTRDVGAMAFGDFFQRYPGPPGGRARRLRDQAHIPTLEAAHGCAGPGEDCRGAKDPRDVFRPPKAASEACWTRCERAVSMRSASPC